MKLFKRFLSDNRAPENIETISPMEKISALADSFFKYEPMLKVQKVSVEQKEKYKIKLVKIIDDIIDELDFFANKKLAYAEADKLARVFNRLLACNCRLRVDIGFAGLMQAYARAFSEGALILSDDDVDIAIGDAIDGYQKKTPLERELYDNQIKRFSRCIELPSEVKGFNYEYFDADIEVLKLRHFNEKESAGLSRQDKAGIQKERLADFKKKYQEQKVEIARLIAQVELTVRSNPDIKEDELMRFIYSRAKDCKLPPHHVRYFEIGIHEYLERHEAVEHYCKIYPDAQSLFETCFNNRPRGRVDVVKGPMTLHFVCHDIDDYALILSRKYNSRASISNSDKNIASLSGGAYLSNSGVKGLEKCIAAENASGKTGEFYEKYSRDVYIHEERHAINSLFIMIEKQHGPKTASMGDLNLVLNRARKEIAGWAKNEILAYLKDNAYSVYKIHSVISEKDGLYDMFSIWRKMTGDAFMDHFKAQGYTESELERLFLSSIRDRHDKILSKATNAIELLKKELGYDNNSLVHIFTNEPLDNWYNVATRLVTMDKIENGGEVKFRDFLKSFVDLRSNRYAR